MNNTERHLTKFNYEVSIVANFSYFLQKVKQEILLKGKIYSFLYHFFNFRSWLKWTRRLVGKTYLVGIKKIPLSSIKTRHPVFYHKWVEKLALFIKMNGYKSLDLLTVLEDGTLIDGHHRLAAIKRVYGSDAEIEVLIYREKI